MVRNNNDFWPFFSHNTLPHTSIGLPRGISKKKIGLKNIYPYEHFLATMTYKMGISSIQHAMYEHFLATMTYKMGISSIQHAIYEHFLATMTFNMGISSIE